MGKPQELRPVPKGLAAAVAKARKHVDKRYVYGLPHYGLNVKLKIQLVELGDMELFDDNDIDVDEHPTWLPFAVIKDESQFLAISTEAPYPVAMWEHEDGNFYPVWPSFDDFVAKVIDKKDKTPFEKLEKQLGKISDLIEKDAYADALGLLEPIMAQLPKLPPGRNFDDDLLARAHNLHGLALKGVKRFAEARAAFETSAAAGDTYAELNILDLLEDERRPDAVVEYGLAARARRYFDDYGRVWLARYLGFAYLDLGDRAKAEAELRRIVDGYAISDPDKVAKAREGLEKYIADDRPGAATARELLAWFKPKTYDVTPEEAKANRAWWDALPEGMRAKLMEEINREGEDPTDADIARCLDVDSLHLDDDDGTFDDARLPVFLRLARCERLAFYGDPDSIEPLRALPKLERLAINNTVIKDFRWPTRADRDLVKAAEAADREGIERALAAGASISARGEHGQSALMLAAGNHDVELCELLIARGADPWAGCTLDANDIFYFFGDDERRVLEQAAAAAGIPHPDDDPFRLLEIQRMPSGASFEKHTALDLDLDDGVPLADRWPAGVQVVMRPPKKEHKLHDLMSLTYDVPLVSARVAEVLRGLPNLELLPVTLLDHAKKPRPEPYFLLNPLAKDCLVIDRCFPEWNHIDPDSASGVAALVIDAARTDGAPMFRPTILNSRPMIVTKELAEQLKGFSGVRVGYLPR